MCKWFWSRGLMASLGPNHIGSEFHPGGNYTSANTRCGSLWVPSVNILFNLEILRQITEVMMTHFPNNQTQMLNNLPRITYLCSKCKKKYINSGYKSLHTRSLLQPFTLSYCHLLTFKLLSTLSLFLSWFSVATCGWLWISLLQKTTG